MENTTRNLKSAIGATIKVTGTKTEINKFGNGVLIILTDDGEAFSTTSKSFAETLKKGFEKTNRFRVTSKTSKAGFEYLVAEPVETPDVDKFVDEKTSPLYTIADTSEV